MAGGPSQLELFDLKPKLQELDGQIVPGVVHQEQAVRLHQAQDAKLLGTRRKFAATASAGAEICELLPHMATVADDIASSAA